MIEGYADWRSHFRCWQCHCYIPATDELARLLGTAVVNYDFLCKECDTMRRRTKKCT